MTKLVLKPLLVGVEALASEDEGVRVDAELALPEVVEGALTTGEVVIGVDADETSEGGGEGADAEGVDMSDAPLALIADGVDAGLVLASSDEMLDDTDTETEVGMSESAGDVIDDPDGEGLEGRGLGVMEALDGLTSAELGETVTADVPGCSVEGVAAAEDGVTEALVSEETSEEVGVTWTEELDETVVEVGEPTAEVADSMIEL